MWAIVDVQIAALRAQIGGLQAMVDALAATVEEAAKQQAPNDDEPTGCLHPELENVGTFGAPQMQCAVCKAMVA